MRELILQHVEEIAHFFAKKILEWDEPIPDFSTRFPGILESCLKTPLQTYDGKNLYPTLAEKGAVLFYLLIKNHPFQNGNKPIAVTSLLTFLALNHKWLKMDPEDLYHLAIWVAESRPHAKDGTLLSIRDTIKKFLIDSK